MGRSVVILREQRKEKERGSGCIHLDSIKSERRILHIAWRFCMILVV